MKVLVAGAGIGGLTLALSLAKQGIGSIVLEQGDSIVGTGAGIQLSPNCSRVLIDLGLQKALSDSAFLPEATRIRSWRSGKVIQQTPLGETATQRFGAPYYHIHRADLIALLLDAALKEDLVELHTGCYVRSVEQGESITVNGQFTGDALVGADGIHSVVRQCLWGDEAPQFTGNIAWRALVPAENLPENFIEPMSTVWWGPGGHFVHYYVRGGQLINCVCVVEKSGWQIESWTEQGDAAELKSDFRGWHDNVQLLIDHAVPDSLYKWALFDRPPMKQWSRDNITLLGDACHPTLPFMAQGAAMAIEDAAILSRCLSSGMDVSSAFLKYEALRKKRTAGVQLGSRRNATVFHLSGIKAWLRNRAVKAGVNPMDKLYRYNVMDENIGSKL